MQHDQHVVSVAVHFRHTIVLTQSRIARGWNPKTSDRTRAPSTSQLGMSTQTSPVSRRTMTSVPQESGLQRLLGYQANVYRPHLAGAGFAPVAPIPGRDRGPSLQDRLPVRRAT